MDDDLSFKICLAPLALDIFKFNKISILCNNQKNK